MTHNIMYLINIYWIECFHSNRAVYKEYNDTGWSRKNTLENNRFFCCQ